MSDVLLGDVREPWAVEKVPNRPASYRAFLVNRKGERSHIGLVKRYAPPRPGARRPAMPDPEPGHCPKCGRFCRDILGYLTEGALTRVKGTCARHGDVDLTAQAWDCEDFPEDALFSDVETPQRGNDRDAQAPKGAEGSRQ